MEQVKMRYGNGLWFFLTLLLWHQTVAGAEPKRAAPAATPPVAAEAPTVTEKQAIEIATRFCRAVGLVLTESAATKGEATFPSESTAYWRPCWAVRFKNQALVEVDGSTGAVAYYHGTKPSRSFRDIPVISCADALAKAAKALQASGISDAGPVPSVGPPEDLWTRLPDGSIEEQPPKTPHEWVFVYNRQFNNLPYRDQDIEITLQAETGELNDFIARFHCPAPISGASTLTQKQAIAAGWFFINRDTTIRNAVLEDAGLCIVQPNRCFTPPNYSEQPLPGPAKLAYVCVFDYQPIMGPPSVRKTNPPPPPHVPLSSAPASVQNLQALTQSDADNSLIVDPPTDDMYNFGQPETHVMVYIDAQTGKCVGGVQSSRGDLPFRTLGEWMKHTRKILVFASDQNVWGEKPVAVLSETENSQWFHQAKSLQNFVERVPGSTEKQTVALKFLLVSDTFEATQEEIYYLTSGKLGKPSVQSDVPSELKTWLNHLAQKQNTSLTVPVPR